MERILQIHNRTQLVLAYSRERVWFGLSLLIECLIIIITRTGYPVLMAVVRSRCMPQGLKSSTCCMAASYRMGPC